MIPSSPFLPALQADLSRCIHCGLCLNVCPTYVVLRREPDGPRGRLALMKAVARGELALEEAGPYLLRCLDCRACEAACPSGVTYGSIWEPFRAALEEEGQTPGVARAMAKVMRRMLPHRNALRWAARGAALARKSGLLPLAERTLGRLNPHLEALIGMALVAQEPAPMLRPGVYPAHGERRGAVAFFLGCVQDAFYARANAAAVAVLRHNGYDVHIPAGQTCCGAVAWHSGDVQHARRLARRNLAAFAPDPDENGESLPVVNAIGGCGATLQEYGHLLGTPEAQALAARAMDITAFLAEHLRESPTRPLPLRVVYVDSCHLRNVQKVMDAPRVLLRRIPQLELVEPAHPERCCGSAGLYSLLQPDLSLRILEAKVEEITETQADVVAVTNVGCGLHVARGLRKRGQPLPVVHVVELLAQAYGLMEGVSL